MKSDYSDSSSERDGEDPNELGWSELQWETYFREQEDIVHRYLGWYEQLQDNPERIDEVARLMRWNEDAGSEEPAPEDRISEEIPDGEWEPYTVHRNPVYIATRAILLSLIRAWEQIAVQPGKIPQALAVTMMGSLHRAEQHSMFAVQALDLGDYTMAVSLLKRALQELNRTMGLIDDRAASKGKAIAEFRDFARPRFFDIREVWLRVIYECREEISRQSGHHKDREED